MPCPNIVLKIDPVASGILHIVTSLDGMTADWARLPAELLAHISNRIINEVRGINRMVYATSSRLSVMLEWE